VKSHENATPRTGSGSGKSKSGSRITLFLQDIQITAVKDQYKQRIIFEKTKFRYYSVTWVSSGYGRA